MRHVRIFALGLVSFFAVLMSALLAPGTFVNRALSAALCTVFSFNSTICTVNLAKSSERVVAATPPAVERNISDWLVRDPGEFDDAPSVRPGSNPQAPPFPQDPGPNQPVRPDFDSPGSGSSADRAIEPGVTMTDARALSSDTFEFTLRSPEDCIFTAIFKAVNGDSFFESARYVPSTADACGSETYSFDFQEQGKKIVATSSSNEIVILEKLSSKIGRLIYQKEGKNIQKNFPLDSSSSQSKTNNEVLVSSNIIMLPSPSQKANNINIVAGWTDRYTQYEDQVSCGVLRGLCDVLPFMQSAALIAAATGVGTSVSAPIFLLHYLGSVGCYMVFGGIPPFPLGSVIARGLGLGRFAKDTLTALNTTNRLSVRTPLNAVGIAGAKLPGFDGPWKNLCKKRETPQPQQTAQQPQKTPQQQAKICRVPQEFWKTHERHIATVRITEFVCVIQGSVMTDQGMADGQQSCGACYSTGNNTFGQPPNKVPCNQADDRARTNPVPPCPANWSGQ
ncbi:MAG: hypothetical protein P2A85_03910 [Microcoleus anatoxicus]|uniref:hypothetical protein n=1 Tax=Microcoleus anatoxicus TaxID=2705319 RepID=UPI00366C50E4